MENPCLTFVTPTLLVGEGVSSNIVFNVMFWSNRDEQVTKKKLTSLINKLSQLFWLVYLQNYAKSWFSTEILGGDKLSFS